MKVPGKRRDRTCHHFANHNYIVDKKVGPTTYLRCTNYRETNVHCLARCKLIGDHFYRSHTGVPHTCSDDNFTLQVRHFKDRLKKLAAADVTLSLNTIYKQEALKERSEVTRKVTFNSIVSAMRYGRRVHWPQWVKTIEDTVNYYEQGGTENDDLAKELYLGTVEHTDEGWLAQSHQRLYIGSDPCRLSSALAYFILGGLTFVALVS